MNKMIAREALNQQEYDLFGDFIDSNLGISQKISRMNAAAAESAAMTYTENPLTSVTGLGIKSQKIELRTTKAEQRTKGFTGNKKRLTHTRQV
mmetsp:Transcript_18760/g.28830  ORF Transcript_18760/g.28830 Transcript_18760/m.28830 type:complete len:93 (+) Transcript_18760:5767-6045(+)